MHVARSASLVDRKEEPPVLDKEAKEALDALADDTANAILRESARLPEREKRIVLGIVQEFADRRDEEQSKT